MKIEWDKNQYASDYAHHLFIDEELTKVWGMDYGAKVRVRWEAPFVIKQQFENGTYLLHDGWDNSWQDQWVLSQEVHLQNHVKNLLYLL